MRGRWPCWCCSGVARRPSWPKGKNALPADVVAGREKAGAAVGSIQLDAFGIRTFVKGGGKAGDVPTFRFAPWLWKDGVVPKLPAPAVPFGLYLNSTKVTDAGLKDLRKALPGCRIVARSGAPAPPGRPGGEPG